MRAVLLCAVLGLVTENSANAASISVIGAGAVSCGKWLEQRGDKRARAEAAQWVFGYLAAYNAANEARQVEVHDTQSVTAFLDRYCSINPLQAVPAAAAALVEELGGAKSKHTWRK